MENIDIAMLVKSLLDWHAWLILAVVAVGGMMGGLAHKLSSQPEDKTSLARYLVVGMVAALAVLFVYAPQDPVRLIALALAAGYGGKAVLDALEAKVKAAVAEAETARAKESGLRAVTIGRQLADHASKLSNLARTMMKDQPEAVLRNIEAALPPGEDLKRLAIELDFLETSLQK
jgi:hypothetical protein